MDNWSYSQHAAFWCITGWVVGTLVFRLVTALKIAPIRLKIKLPHVFHSWIDVRQTGCHLYEKCLVCDERRVRRKCFGGYQPIDVDWLATGKFADRGNPPKADMYPITGSWREK